MIDAVIFDLDGTLIDSSDGVLQSFRGAFAATGHEPVRTIASDIIGPPLMETLALLAGTDDEGTLRALAREFKACYDRHGYKLTTRFPGVDEMLRELAGRGHALYIATNKRLLPTQRILEHLGWAGYFQGVYALDSFDPPLRRKADMLSQVLDTHRLEREQVIYIGDRDEDGEAAAANGLRFGFAAWGYGSICGAGNLPGCITMRQPEAVTAYIARSRT